MNEETTKSALIRQLYQQGMSVADIARELNTYYSFVYRVLTRYLKRRPTQRNGINFTKEVKDLWEQGKSLDQIMSLLKLEENRRSHIYSMVQKFRKEKKNAEGNS